MSGIPVPDAGGSEEEYTSICELYDGDASTAGVCNGWITKTEKCTRRDDELGDTCDGCGNFPPEVEEKYED